jgi:hypothetical protein
MKKMLALLLGVAFCLPPSAAPAQQGVGPSVYHSLESGASPRLHGRIVGRIARVDYTNSIIYVRTSYGVRAVAIMPSTEIDVRGGGYGSIDDLHVGSLVDIDATVAANRVIAQIIHIR